PGDLAASHVGRDERLVHSALDIARSRLDADAQMIRRTGQAVTERATGVVRDQRCRFRRAAVDAEVVRHAIDLLPQVRCRQDCSLQSSPEKESCMKSNRVLTTM